MELWAFSAQSCAASHGKSASDFSGEYVGKATPIAAIGTDRGRLDSYTLQLAQNQGMLYSAVPERSFSHFRKTWGYANAPLDGLWLRAPYLHNGSVPTLRDLLEPPANRPAVFWRGYDVYDQARMGFVTDGDEAKRVGTRHDVSSSEGRQQPRPRVRPCPSVRGEGRVGRIPEEALRCRLRT